MKTETCKKHLLTAISTLPNDNVLFQAKAFLKKALLEIEQVENKRGHRKITQINNEQIWKEKMAASASVSQNPTDALKRIEQMIEEEQKKMKQQTTTNKSQPTKTLLD